MAEEDRPPAMETRLGFRWLGAAGIELVANGETLVIDPFFSRFPLWRVWLGRVRSNRALAAEKAPRCDLVLVTHAHVDHLLDVAEVVRNTGALVLGSPATCRLLAAEGIPALRIHEIAPGAELTLGSFRIRVVPGAHRTLFGRPILTGPLPSRLKPPLRARDYRMDHCYSFLIESGGCRLLDWAGVGAEGALPADVLFVSPCGEAADYQALLSAVQPRAVVPIHWDDFFRPLSRPVRPMLQPSARGWPPLQTTDLARFRRIIKRAAPSTQVFVPRMFQAYEVPDWAGQ